MLKFASFTLIAISLLSLSSCFQLVKITQNFKDIDYPFRAVAGKTICVEAAYLKNGSGFSRSIKREYNDDRSYIDTIQNKVRASLQALNVKSPDLNLTERNVNFVQRESFDNDEKQSLFNTLKSDSNVDYLMVISLVSVEKNVAHNGGMMTFSNGTTSHGGGSTIKCVVNIDVELWDIAKKSKVLEFRSHGEEMVHFFATDLALRNATAKSVQNLSNYIVNGKI